MKIGLERKYRIVLYTIFMCLSALLGVLKFGYFAKLLSIEMFGQYSLVLSLYIFIIYIGSLGFNEALLNLGSIAEGKKDNNKVNTLLLSAILCGGAGVAIVGVFFIFGVNLLIKDKFTVSVLQCASLLAFSAFQYNIISTYLRVKQCLVAFSSMLFLKSVFTIGIGYFFVKYGARGLLIAESFIFFSLAFGYYFRGEKNKLEGASEINFKLLLGYVRSGFPVLLSNLIRNISLVVDKVMIASSMGWIEVAKYNLGMTMYLVGFSVLGMLSNILGPRWLSAFSSNEDKIFLLDKIRQTVLYILAIMLSVGLVFFIFLPSILNYIYPDYAGRETIFIFLFIYFGTVILVLTLLFEWYFVAISMEKILTKMSFLNSVFSLFLMACAWFFYRNIIFYAFIFFISRVFGAVLCLYFLRNQFNTYPTALSRGAV